MTHFSLSELEDAAKLVYRHMRPTPEYVWPLLSEAANTEVWVKHENHCPIGAFKVRGGITYVDWLKRTQPEARGICTATRGNHGQSQARAARAVGLTAKVLVPHGNSYEKNAAMRAFGAELLEFGDDFDSAREEAIRIAAAEGLVIVPPFHREIIRGVATYAYELFCTAPELDTVYVPIGCGSGICGTIAARDALGLKTKVVGVVSDQAQTAKLSMEAGKAIETATANTFADGIAVRAPVADALAIYSKGAERIVAVSDDEIAEAIRLYFRTTHNLAEGAGAAPLAALISEREKMRGKTIGLILSGGNIDSDKFAEVIRGNTPSAA